jgi:hypothetical protein
MKLSLALIHLYQRSPLVNRLVRRGVRTHHAIFKPELRPCPFAGTGTRCSAGSAAQIQTLGAAVAIPVIASQMAHCGGGGVREERFQWCI